MNQLLPVVNLWSLTAVKSLVNASNFPLKLSYIFSSELLFTNIEYYFSNAQNKLAIDELHTKYSELLLSHGFAFILLVSSKLSFIFYAKLKLLCSWYS